MNLISIKEFYILFIYFEINNYNILKIYNLTLYIYNIYHFYIIAIIFMFNLHNIIINYFQYT